MEESVRSIPSGVDMVSRGSVPEEAALSASRGEWSPEDQYQKGQPAGRRAHPVRRRAHRAPLVAPERPGRGGSPTSRTPGCRGRSRPTAPSWPVHTGVHAPGTEDRASPTTSSTAGTAPDQPDWSPRGRLAVLIRSDRCCRPGPAPAGVQRPRSRGPPGRRRGRGHRRRPRRWSTGTGHRATDHHGTAAAHRPRPRHRLRRPAHAAADLDRGRARSPTTTTRPGPAPARGCPSAPWWR